MQDTKYHVVGLGNAIVDVLSFVDQSFLDQEGLSRGHLQLITENASNNLYKKITPYRQSSGGSAANTIAGLASLNLNCAYVGVVKDDHFGQQFIADLKGCGVDLPFTPRAKGDSTARSIILITPDAERTMNTYLGASTDIHPHHVDPELIANGQIFFSEAYLWSVPHAQKSLKKAIEVAQSARRRVALTLSCMHLMKRERKTFFPFIQNNVEIILGNEEEACALYGTDFDNVVRQCQKDFHFTAITRGKKGSILISKNEIIEIGRDPVDTIKDTTGAGDLYASGFLFGMALGLAYEMCGRIGSITAGEIIQHIGARTETSLKKLIQERTGFYV